MGRARPADVVYAAVATPLPVDSLKLSRHHSSVSSRMRLAVAPCRRIAISTTIAAM